MGGLDLGPARLLTGWLLVSRRENPDGTGSRPHPSPISSAPDSVRHVPATSARRGHSSMPCVSWYVPFTSMMGSEPALNQAHVPPLMPLSAPSHAGPFLAATPRCHPSAPLTHFILTGVSVWGRSWRSSLIFSCGQDITPSLDSNRRPPCPRGDLSSATLIPGRLSSVHTLGALTPRRPPFLLSLLGVLTPAT